MVVVVTGLGLVGVVGISGMVGGGWDGGGGWMGGCGRGFFSVLLSSSLDLYYQTSS